MAKIFLYSTTITNRFLFTSNWIFEEVLELEAVFTTSIVEFQNFKGIKINYSDQEIAGAIQVIPQGILDESNFGPAPLSNHYISQIREWLKAPESITFDYFSLVFYCISRYEEYHTTSLDKHGRFTLDGSLNSLLNSPKTPIVDKLIFHLQSFLKQKHPNYFIWEPRVNMLPTVDIDMIYKYKHRPLFRTISGITRDVFANNWGEVKERIQVLWGKKADPYFIFQEFLAEGKYSQIPIHFFLHCGDYGPFDKQVGLNSKEFRDTLIAIHKIHAVGLHPSYKSNNSTNALIKEKQKLESLLLSPCTSSRQHFLKMSLPETYRKLVDIGVKEDSTMGYAEAIGFRAGTSRSFPFYDLEREEVLPLLIHPFCAMDVSLKRYLKLNHIEARKELGLLKSEVQKYGGSYRVLFHNESLSENGEWEGWSSLFLS